MAKGDIAATLSVSGRATASFYLVENPGGYFAISGNNLIEAIDTPDGDYPVTVGALLFSGTSVESTIMEPFILEFFGSFPPPPPPPPPLTSTVSAFPTSLGIGQTSLVSFTWNDVVIDFTLPAVAVTGGTLSSLIQVTGTQYRSTFTPTIGISGTATIQVQQSGIGGAVYYNALGSVTTASNIATIAVNTRIPPPNFYFGLNLSGAENQYPQFTGPAELTYWAERGISYFRFPFSWSKGNPTFGTTGIQPTAFGALDTTTFNLPLQGTNLIYNSDQPTLGPWQNFIASGTLVITPNVTTDPNGFPAHQISASRPSNTSYAVVETNGNWPAGPNTWGILYKAFTFADVGKNFQLNFYQNGAIAIQTLTLTNSWQFASTTATLNGGLAYAQITPFADDSLSINILFSEAQVNVGSSRLPYVPTIAGYVQALDDFFNLADSLGVNIMLDCHMFGGGPGGLAVGSPGLPVSAMVDMWSKIVTRYGQRASLYAVELMNEPVNGFDVSIVMDWCNQCVAALRASPINYTGQIHCDGTNYTGAWNYVSGQGQPYNNANMYRIFDLLNNLVFPAHCYFDRDSSGSNFAYQIESVTPGVSPPGVDTNPTIGITRMSDEYIPWLTAHNVKGVLGEWGISTDPLYAGGDYDWADWIIIGRNTVDLCRANNIPVLLWGGGPGLGAGPNGYPFSPTPYSSTTGGTDFSSVGVQSVLVSGIINHYVTNPQPQPTAYALRPPVTITPTANPEAPIVTINYYGTVGTATNSFTIIYGGIVLPGAQITPHAYLSDGITPAGGTFTPAVVALNPGENALATFVYTPAIVDTILISTTNNQGWTDPPALVVSTQDDAWKDIGLTPTPLYNLYRTYTPYIGPALQLKSPLTGQVQNWSFTNGNNLDRVAIQAWAGQQSGIPVSIRYDHSPLGSNMVLGAGATLNLQNATGYPEIVYTNLSGTADIPVSRKGAVTVLARMSQGVGPAPYIWMELFASASPFSFGEYAPLGNNYLVVENSGYVGGTVIGAPGNVGTVALGIAANVYHEYAATYQAGVTNGLKSYIDGSLHATAALNPTVTSSFTFSQSGTTGTVSALVGIINIGDQASATSSHFVSQVSGPTGGNGVYTMDASASVTNVASNGVGINYNLNSGFDNQNATFGYALFGASGWHGADQFTGFIVGTAASSAQITTVLSYETAHYSTPLPDMLPPIFTNVSNGNAISGTSATPFENFVLEDVAGTSVSIVFTLTGHTATLSGTGLTGSNPYTLTSDTVANINTKMQALQFNTTGSPGAVTNIAMVATSSTTLTCSAAPTVTIFNATNPVISGMVGPNVSQDQGAPPLWQITVTDANPSPMVSASIAVTGSAGTMSYIGVVGQPVTNPWNSSFAPTSLGPPTTFAPMTPANLTRALRNLLWLPSTTTVGTTTTFTVTITNAVGLTASASNTITNIAIAAMPTPYTPVASPGTLPRSYKGINFSGGEHSPPQYVTNSSYYSWAEGEGLDTIRLPFLFSYLLETSGSTFPILYQGFNSQALSLQVSVEYARQNGQYIILDDHSYGGVINPFNTGTVDDAYGIGYTVDVRAPLSAFVDSWTRLFTLFQNYPNIILGLQNECQGYWNQAKCRTVMTAVSTAIRAVGTFGAHVPIYSPNVSNVTYFDSNLTTSVWLGYTDPAGGPFYFDVHQYFDGAGGSLNTCTNNAPGVYFDNFTNFCRANGFKGVVTEFAYGTSTTCTNTPPNISPGVPNYFTTNNDVYIGWNWWWTGNVPTSALFFLGPGGTNAQLSTLTSNLGNTF